MTIFALLGSTALWLLYAWLLSAIIASYLSGRKGYGERPGLAAGLILTVAGVLIFIIAPAKEGSNWKVVGPFGRQKQEIPPQPTPPKGPAGDAAAPEA